MRRISLPALLPLAVAAFALWPANASAQWVYPYPIYGVPYGLVAELRIQAKPKNAEVYIDGYYAGIVDDFDGAFQHLSARPGPHEIVLYLDGYRTFKQEVYLTPDNTMKLKATLEKLPPGAPSEPRPTPPPPPPPDQQAPPPERGPSNAPPPPRGGMPPQGMPPQGMPPQGRPGEPPHEAPPHEPSRFGTLSVAVQPGGADIFVDGQRWEGPQGEERVLIQVPGGSHHVEVRKDGFDTYATDVDVQRGATIDLSISLTKR